MIHDNGVLDFVVPLVVVVPIGVMLVLASLRFVAEEERAWLGRMVFIALAIRVTMAILFSAWPDSRMFHEDAAGYEGVGMLLAAGWRHEAPPLLIAADHNQGYFYLCASIYYAIGGYRAAPSLVNCVIGALTIVGVYLVAREFFRPIIARRAAAWCALFPSMILWSAVALKDAVVTFLIVLAVLGCVRLKRRVTVLSLLLAIVPLALIQPLRFYMIYFVGFAIIASLGIERGGRLFTGVPKLVFLGGGALGLFVLVGLAGSAQAGLEFLDFERVSSFRYGMAVSANSGFAADVDISSPAKAVAFLPLGVSMLLLSPFPWQLTSMRAAFALPEMLVWWALFPSLIRGLRFALRERFASTSPILIFSATLTCAYSLVHGNVGSAFRQRAQIFVFLFIFCALGLYLKRCRRLGVDVNELLVEPPPPGASP
jgi:hypothetical protein